MAEEQYLQHGRTSSRRASTSSSHSTLSDPAHATGRPTSRGQGTIRLPLAPRQTLVSMFTGVTGDGPASPSRKERSQNPLSPGSIDRVFPVRSAVSIDPSATPVPQVESGDGFPGFGTGTDTGYPSQRDHTRTQSSRPSRSPSSEGSRARRSGSISDRLPSYDRRKRALNPELRPTQARHVSGSTDANTVASRADHQPLQSLLADSASVKSEATSESVEGGVPLASNPGPVHDPQEPGLVTARFKHIVTNGGHAIITGRAGDTLQRCEDEPIHIPGAIQSFGALLAFREEGEKLVVRVVSENSHSVLGYTPAQLFALDNLLDIFSEEQADNLLDHLDFIRDDTAADVILNGPEVFMMSVRPPGRRTRKLWCAMHVPQTDQELVVCEFEFEDDQVNPLMPAGEGTPELPEDTLGSNPTPEELAESTKNMSKPLRILRSARKKRGEAAAMEVFNIMSQVQEQLANAPNLQVFLRVLIGVVKELCGFHRVMIYQFDQAWNGRVVAELVDPRTTKDLYKGLNFPASDIPRQARELYKLNKVRLLYDRDQETARLVCRTMEDLETPLDLSHAYLRAMSPVHLKYLANMAVRSSMSISINAFDELWGLIACHSYGPKGMRVSFPIRKMCRLVGDTASRNIERLSYASRLQARKLINTSSTAANPSGYIVASSDDLLKLFDADVGALSIRDETKIMGKAPGHLQEVLVMVEYLRIRKFPAVFTSQDISTDFTDLRFPPGLKYLAGLLYVPLSGSGNDFIAFFRKGVLQEVKWAGNPYEKFIKEGTEGYLEPRKSFKAWSETIVGRCRDWTEDEIETASVLCLVYGKFIDVWRQKEAALHNSQLTRLLLANSAHEVRTPLNAIINYLEIALESKLDQETRENLIKSHSASKSLVYVINDLLDLTKAAGGRELVKDEVFDLQVTMREATDPFSGDAKRKNIEYEVSLSPDFPTKVIGDHRRVRQVVSNLVANAIQHTTTGKVSVEAWIVPDQSTDGRVEVEIAVEDTGAGMSQIKVDALFRELEEVSYENDVTDTQLFNQDPFVNSPESPDRSALGLGLAVVARTIRHMNGQLRLKTEEGTGSRFVIQLGFEVDAEGDAHKLIGANQSPVPQQNELRQISTPDAAHGEVTLVERSTSKRANSEEINRKPSRDSFESLQSNKSQTSIHSIQSQKSDVDRLIDAIQEPLRPSVLSRNSSDGKASWRPKNAESPEISPTRQKPRSSKARSLGSSRDLEKPRSAFAKLPGQEPVTDSGVPIKPVRVPEEGMEKTPSTRTASRVVFEEPEPIRPTSSNPRDENLSTENFSILVAEDDPINSRIVKKRLEKLGHTVRLTVNGEECSSAHGDEASSFDAVLMDLQVSRNSLI